MLLRENCRNMSSDIQHSLGGDGFLEQSSILDDSRQRCILSILLEHSHPMTGRDLAVQIAAREAGTTPSDVTEEDPDGIQTDLHHRCLPKLEAVGWIERRPEGIVASESLSSGKADLSLLSLDDADVRWEQLAAVLARPHRKHLLSILVRKDPPLSLEELAVELAAYEHPRWTIDGDEETLSVALHHVDLPTLEAVGLLRYDPDERTITRNHALATIATSRE